MTVCKHCEKPIAEFESHHGTRHIHVGTGHIHCNPHSRRSTIATPKEAS